MVYKSLRKLAPRMLTRAQHWLLPTRCIACGCAGGLQLGDAHAPLDLCSACYRQLPFNRHGCLRCGLPLSETVSGMTCGQCLRKAPAYQRSYCAFEYRYPLAFLVRNLKYGAQLPPARVLGELLANHLLQHHQEPWPQCIIPVPLHISRYQQRGYNQVIELATYLHRRLNLPLRLDLLERIRATAEQAGLTRTERRRNLRRAFRTTGSQLPDHVALLDDVITTGSTVNEAALTLRKAGVGYIEVWGLARATTRSA